MKRLISALLLLSLTVPARPDDLPELGDISSATLSPQQEQALGREVMLEIRSDRDYFSDPFTADYLNALGYKLVANAGGGSQAFEFFVVRDSTLNAFALPGGFVGVHTGLLLAAESESELAGVLAHEIAHVTQHHQARMMEAQSRNTLPMLAALALAILAARNSPQGAQAAIVGTQAGAIQSQINFTRDNEREADRMGLQTLVKSGFDPRGMASFFERMQKYTRFYETNAPAYLRTHPLTYERIADIEDRLQGLPYRQVPDSIDFQLMRARLRVLLETPRDAVQWYDSRITEGADPLTPTILYGRTLALVRARRFAEAHQELARLKKQVPDHLLVYQLTAQLRHDEGDLDGAISAWKDALAHQPDSRGLHYGYVETLLEAGQAQAALDFVSQRLQITHGDDYLYELQARAYAALHKELLQHRAQAEAYVNRGNISAAVDQLQIALRSPDGDFYSLSSTEARLKELRAIMDYDRQQRGGRRG
ncbi:MAG: M48 family metallopeptidase [Pseudomonadota bacterium]|nr:M48 family metallopeptidase [Pseudomonadota bacterium]